MTPVRHFPLVAILTLAACAPGLKPGALSPVGARVTNEVLDNDQRTFAAWSRRLAAIGTSTAPSTPERTYTAARAAAWLGLARDAYAADPRDTTADRALAETGRLVIALESNAPIAVERLSGIPSGPRSDLWAALDSMRSNGGPSIAPAALADLEVTLVRASYLSAAHPVAGTALVRNAATAEQICDVQSLLTRAEQLLMNLRGSAGQTASISSLVPLPSQAAPAYTVRLAGEASATAVPVVPAVPVAPKAPAAVHAPVAPPASAPVIDTLTPMQIEVHFAPMSSAITAESRVALDEAIVGLRIRRAARIMFEGYTGKRAAEQFDRDLVERRGNAVRQYLADAKLDLPRLTMAGRRSAIGAERGEMRVLLTFIGPDGRTVTLQGIHDALPQTGAAQESHDAMGFTQPKVDGRDRSANFPR